MTDSDATEPRLHRVTVNLSPRTNDALRGCAAREGVSMTDVINKAVQLYDSLKLEMELGMRLYTQDPQDPKSLQQVRIF